jgi:PEP-CTERM motif
MKLASSVLAIALVAGGMPVWAGNFVTLPTGPDPLSSANGGLLNGSTNQNADRFYIETTSASYLAGHDDTRAPGDGGTGDIVPTSIDYRTFSGGTTTGTGTLTLLDWRVTTDVPLLPGVPQATIFDYVYQDSADNKLVFGTRYLNMVDNNQEANFLYRYGFADFATAAAWTFSTDGDLRLYQAGRTSSFEIDPDEAVDLDLDAVRQKGDFSVTEGNPWSGLFLVKTDAPYYVLGSQAIGFAQGGEEDQEPVLGSIAGFVPSTTPVPEPETYAMLIAGLGLLGLAVRRRRQQS